MMDDSTFASKLQMEIMIYAMPIMSTIFVKIFPLVLALYWVVGNVFMVIQTFFMHFLIKDNSNVVGKVVVDK